MNVVLSGSRNLDYAPCHYGAAPSFFRGPHRRLTGDYLACIGSTETFGKYIETPYPQLIEQGLGVPTLNLGCQNAGIDAFISQPSLIEICSAAQVTVIQIMSATHMSNRHYTVDPRNNDRFLRASKALKAIYPEVDFTAFDRIDQVLGTLARVSPDRLHQVRREVQSAWVARMRGLIAAIDGPIILLWLARHEPYSRMTGGTICREPLFVDRSMLNAITGPDTHLAEIVVPPHDIAAGLNDMVYPVMERHSAQALLGPVAHRSVAQMLAPALTSILQQPENICRIAKD